MAESCVPFDGGPFMYEAQWASLFALVLTNGVSSRASNGLEVYSDADGRQVKVRAGVAHIRGHLYQSTDVIIKQLAPNTSGNPRIDALVLRLDTSAKTATPFVIPGTPVISPSPPAIIQVPGGIWDLPLANVRCESAFTSIASTGKITDTRSYVAFQGDFGQFGGASGTYAKVQADGADAEIAATGTNAAIDMILKSKGNGGVQMQDASGTIIAQGVPNQGLVVGASVNSGNAQPGVLSISDIPAALSGNPTSGGYLYVDAGSLKFRGPTGTVTTIAPA